MSENVSFFLLLLFFKRRKAGEGNTKEINDNEIENWKFHEYDERRIFMAIWFLCSSFLFLILVAKISLFNNPFRIILREIIIRRKSKSIRESYYIRMDKTNSFPRTRKRSENRGRKTVDAKIIGLFLFRPSVSRYSDAWHLESLLCHAFPSGTGEEKKRKERGKEKKRKKSTFLSWTGSTNDDPRNAKEG